MGSGDWNDGMNHGGGRGRGESTWLGFFLHIVLSEFAPLCAARGRPRPGRALPQRGHSACEHAGADVGRRVVPARLLRRRDPAGLGAERRVLDRLDRAVLGSALGRGSRAVRGPGHGRRAHRPAVRRGPNSCCCSRPRSTSPPRIPGTSRAIRPGCARTAGSTRSRSVAGHGRRKSGRGDEAVELFHMLNPMNHTRTAADVERYKGEPYVMAGDVCAHHAHVGRAGWTWYTGSAAWMYRAGLESILGLRRRGSTFEIDPCIPSSWPDYDAGVACGPDALRDSRDEPGAALPRGSGQAELVWRAGSTRTRFRWWTTAARTGEGSCSESRDRRRTRRDPQLPAVAPGVGVAPGLIRGSHASREGLEPPGPSGRVTR